MSEICIVSCSKSKIWDYNPRLGKVPAAKAYTGTLTRLAIRYAEMFYPGHWYILSAKYGFLRPEDEIEPYDQTFKNMSITRDLVLKLREQAVSLGLTRCDTVVVLGGKVYADVCRKVFWDKRVIAPLEGLGYFKAVKLLKEAISRGERVEKLRATLF